MTMHPDDRPMPPRVTVWTDEEAERIASHVESASVYSALHEDAEDWADGMGGAAWLALVWMLALAMLIVWVVLT